MSNLIVHSSGDKAGHYYTAPGSTPEERAQQLYAVQAPVILGADYHYLCPANGGKPSHGPFIGADYSEMLGPVGSSKPWTAFAAWNESTGAMPLPHTIQATELGFQFSIPPVFNFGNTYQPSLPFKNGQAAAQYFGNFQNDFIVAPAVKNGEQIAPAEFPLPDATSSTPFTQLEGFSDWAATVSLSNAANQAMQLTFATGSPLAFLTFNTPYAFVRLNVVTERPLRCWFPINYRPQTPAGVNIVVAGAPVVSDGTRLELKQVVVGTQQTPPTDYVILNGQTQQQAAEEFRAACLANKDFTALLNVGPVNVTDNGTSHQFLLTPREPGITLTQDNVTAAPTGAAQAIVIARTQPAMPVNPPTEIVGITITGQYFQAGGQTGNYCASYVLVAPQGAKWFFDAPHLVCDFTQARSQALILVAMPTVSDQAYADYDRPDTGAAAILQSFWEVMQPLVYGCPRQLTADGKDEGTGTRFGPNSGNQFTPQVSTANGKTTVTTEFSYNLSYPAGQPAGAAGTLFALFPHQWRPYAHNPVAILQAVGRELTYVTIMGTMKLAGGGATPGCPAFTTCYTFPGVLAGLPNAAALTGAESFQVYDYPSTTPGQTTQQTFDSQLLQDADTPYWAADISGKVPVNAFIPIPPVHQQNFSLDSYNWGKMVGLVGDLIQPAFLLGNEQAARIAIRQLNAQLGQWLSGALLGADAATPFPPGVEAWQKEKGNSAFAGTGGVYGNQQFLYYEQQWSALNPYPTGFEADTLLNDHHFHYGYWLRAAAQLALAQAAGQDPDNLPGTFIANYGATVNLIIKDIANPLRGDQGAVGDDASHFPNGPATPFLRHFDGYFGHSWASGLRVNIIDQESLSEAMSAWSGVMLWGEITGDVRQRDLGIWMYTHEMLSFYEYWMDCGQCAQIGSILFPPGTAKNVVGNDYADSIKGSLPTGDVGFFSQVFSSYSQLASFFGWDPLFLAGIQWLPFHGGSLYLSSTDAAVHETLQKVFTWCKSNAQFQWDNQANQKPLFFIDEAAKYIEELNLSATSGTATDALRQVFKDNFYPVLPKEDEKDGVKVGVEIQVANSEWQVHDPGRAFYTVHYDTAAQRLSVSGRIEAYQPTYFFTGWEPVAWQFAALLGDTPADAIWKELQTAIASGDREIYGKGWKPLVGQAVSSSYYWIHTTAALGRRDAAVSADYPFAVKFLKDGKASYVVWNLTGAPLTVNFSDGRRIDEAMPYRVTLITA